MHLFCSCFFIFCSRIYQPSQDAGIKREKILFKRNEQWDMTFLKRKNPQSSSLEKVLNLYVYIVYLPLPFFTSFFISMKTKVELTGASTKRATGLGRRIVLPFSSLYRNIFFDRLPEIVRQTASVLK